MEISTFWCENTAMNSSILMHVKNSWN